MVEKMKCLAVLPWVTGSFFLGCGLVPSAENTGEKGGARLVRSSGKVVRVGSSDAQAGKDEQPGFVRFGYDFWLDTTEVTQAEYQALMGANPSPASATSSAKPVVNTTWFDAVLFCNARSKLDRLDTVYDYSSKSVDSTGSVWNLQGFASHLDRNGWRLPTEAEWEFAARAGAASAYSWGGLSDSARAAEYAWFQKNANASLHEVARLKPNAWGFYDMAGNVMEWVQDWKGSFPKDTVTDYGGPDAPGDVPEVPLKGGAYVYGLGHLRPSSRSATYAAYRSAKAEYVGFRCARGGFQANYTDATGQKVDAPPVTIVHPNLLRTLGARSARLVFLNRSNGKNLLSWIDYGEATPVVRSLPDKDPVFHPAISPDGKWVVWCTVLEGSTGTSRIKARRLTKNDSTVLDLGAGAIPRWWVNGSDTFLVRSTSARDDLSQEWMAGVTSAQTWSGEGRVGESQNWALGSYHDGRTGQYLYTGYRRLKQYDAVNRIARTQFIYPQNGKGVGDTSQVCNVSAAPDNSGRAMFLDFGYSGSSTVVGRPYGIHEVAFVADSQGNVVKTFPVASGKSQWDQLEWSNHPRWAVGVALENNGAYNEIHLLDLADGATAAVIKGSELWMPGLWVGDASSGPSENTRIDADSALQYNTPWTGANQEGFAAKAVSFWKIHDQVEVVFSGNSRIESGLLPGEMSRPSFNWGYWGGQMSCDARIVRDYIIPHCKRLRAVVLSLEPGYIFRDQSLMWNRISQSLGYQYDRNHAFWRDSVPGEFAELAKARTWPMSARYDSIGETHYPASGWGANPPEIEGEWNHSLQDSVFLSNWKKMRDLVAEIDGKGLEVYLVNFPQSPLFRTTAAAGRYGPSWSVYDSLIAKIHDLESEFPRFHLIDAYNSGINAFTAEDAVDEDHLAYTGGQKVTRMLDSAMSLHLRSR